MSTSTAVEQLLAALVASVPEDKRHLIEQESYEYTVTFTPGSLAEGVTLHVLDDGTPTRL
jgi:hypothetical protein